MQEFSYVVKDPIGIHARPAGLLVKEAKKYKSVVSLEAKGKRNDMRKLLAIMQMGVKCGTEVRIVAEGIDEDAAIIGMKKFFEENL